jgi:hypothetical protein
MEAAVLNNDTALLMLLEAKLAITQSNLNDFFITVSAILVFGNYFSIHSIIIKRLTSLKLAICVII